MKDARFYGLLALGLALFPVAIHPIKGYPGLATHVVIIGIAAIGFNLLLGYAGLLSYGQAMFYGVGSYVGLLTVSRFFPDHPNLWLALALATIFAMLLAFAIGLLTVRLYGIYFTLLTLAFAQMSYFVVFEWRDLTGGDDGLQGIAAPPLQLGFTSLDLTQKLPVVDLGPFGNLSDVTYWYVFGAVLAFGAVAFMRVLVRSQFGEVLAAIRENEERSTFIGFDPMRYKLAAFTIAGALAGLSGALEGFYQTSTAVETLRIEQSGDFVVDTIVGGVSTLLGPLVGTAIVEYLQNVVGGLTEQWRLIEGILFVVVIVFFPGGLLGALRKNNARSVVAGAVRTGPKSDATRPTPRGALR
jgi:branched-chain amino acid transport system permease protein